MTQQSLITRLKAVEEALEDPAIYCSLDFCKVSGEESCCRAKQKSALSDLRELIKEAEGHEPKAWSDAWGVPFNNREDAMVDDESTPAPLYTALGENP